MKKVLFVSILAGLALVGCTNDELVDNNVLGGNNEFIGFSVNQKNMTRGTGDKEKLQNSHYEFGVFANNGATVMKNYLVAYGDNALYQTLKNGSSTFGDPNSQVDGLSYWFYEGLTPDAGKHTAYNTPDLTQILKFWDKSTSAYEFWAYTPYTTSATTALTGHNATKVVADEASTLTFTGLSSFYTTPVNQISTAYVPIADNDAEVINYNEALYAYNKVEKPNYGNDVPLDFKHINAKVKIAFYNAVAGYDIVINDLVPSAITNAWGATVPQTEGIQLTPANAKQAIYYDNDANKYLAQRTDLPHYYQNANVEVSGLTSVGATGTIALTGEAATDSVNKNLEFAAMTGNISTEQTNPTVSGTTLYVLPNYANGAYITDDPSEEGTTVPGEVSSTTGYTLHVSYTLKPKDGSADIKIYDARVYIPAANCRWEAGKAYTYIFKITKNANGTTDPINEPDLASTTDPADPTTATQGYVDPTDPRVPDEGALQPIVFDGIMVADYDDPTKTEYILTEATLSTAFEKALASIKTQFSNGGPKATTISATGTGATSTDPFVVNYTVKVSDFKWTGWDETNAWDLTHYDLSTINVNDNNVYKDVQALFQAMYNQSGIQTVNYSVTVPIAGCTDPTGAQNFTRCGVAAALPASWYNMGSSVGGRQSIETHIAADVFATATGGTASLNTGTYPVNFSIKDSKGNESFVKLNVEVVAD